MELDGAAGCHAAIHRLGDLGGGPDQDVGVPNGRQPEFRVGADLDPDTADIIFDRREPGFLGEAEERPLHGVALVTDRNVREIRREQVGLVVTFGGKPFRHGVAYGYPFSGVLLDAAR